MNNNDNWGNPADPNMQWNGQSYQNDQYFGSPQQNYGTNIPNQGSYQNYGYNQQYPIQNNDPYNYPAPYVAP